MVVNRKQVYPRSYGLLNTLIKKSFGNKVTHKLYFSRGRKALFFIFSYEENHFAELGIAVSYFALEAIVGWCSPKVDVL